MNVPNSAEPLVCIVDTRAEAVYPVGMCAPEYIVPLLVLPRVPKSAAVEVVGFQIRYTLRSPLVGGEPVSMPLAPVLVIVKVSDGPITL